MYVTIKRASAKPTIRLARPAKTQISLAVWSVFADCMCLLQHPKRDNRERLPYWLGNLFLAHLSRRLIGELIIWQGRCLYVYLSVCLSTFSNIFSETAGPMEAKFHVEPPWDGGTKVCSRGPGHMTKMAAIPIYGKTPSKIFFSGTAGTNSTKLNV